MPPVLGPVLKNTAASQYKDTKFQTFLNPFPEKGVSRTMNSG